MINYQKILWFLVRAKKFYLTLVQYQFVKDCRMLINEIFKKLLASSRDGTTYTFNITVLYSNNLNTNLIAEQITSNALLYRL